MKIIKNTLLLLFSLLFCFALLEGAIRIYSSISLPRRMVLDDQLGWKHNTGLRKHQTNEDNEKALNVQNEHGHRGPFVAYGEPRANKYRVLFVGDSFTEGADVNEDELFSAHIQATDPTLEVINTGVGAYSTVQEYIYTRDHGLKYKPQLVVMNIYVNDLTENTMSYYPIFGPRPYADYVDGKLVINESLDAYEYNELSLPLPFRETLNRYSYLYYFLNSKIYQKLFAKKISEALESHRSPHRQENSYNIIHALIERMKDLTDANNAQLALVLIPSREEAIQGQSSDNTLSPIADFCGKEKLTCLNLTERFSAEIKAGKSPYFDVDIHWRKAGHAFAAEEMAPFIQKIRRG